MSQTCSGSIISLTDDQITKLKQLPAEIAEIIPAVWDMVSPEWRSCDYFSVIGKPLLLKTQVSDLLEHWISHLPMWERSQFILTWCNYAPATTEVMA